MKNLTKEMEELLKNYTNGQYGTYTSYSQYLIDDSRIKYVDVEFYEKYHLPKVTEEEKRDAVEIMNTINNQEVVSNDLYRFLAMNSKTVEKHVNTFKVNEVIGLGITSTSRNPKLLENILLEADRGLDIDLREESVVLIKVVGDHKELDVSDFSKYKTQEESLICGKFIVENVEEIDVPEQKFEFTFEEYAKLHNYIIKDWEYENGKKAMAMYYDENSDIEHPIATTSIDRREETYSAPTVEAHKEYHITIRQI